ncbi:winged helix-turn-helix domain-containing protein [Candidatus Roizmanbacteria bacterium]|nr:winged helix-turn-helix domain-containing protein [Candidatus Roizmanbacteria bacterium]
MKKVINSLTEETLENDARRWLNIVRYNESGTIIQLQNDAIYRVSQLINDKKILKKTLGPYYRKYLLAYISLSENHLLESINKKLLKLIKSKKIGLLPDEDSIDELLDVIEKKGLDIGLFIDYGTNVFLNESDHKQLFELESIIRRHKNLSIIFFSEIDITEGKYNKLVNQCSSIFTHIIKYPLYNEKDSNQFINYNENLWKVKFPENIRKEIIKNCGGYLWLVRQALRLLRDDRNLRLEQIFQHELMVKKLDVIWQKLTEKERDVIRKIHSKNLNEELKNSHSYLYLKSIRMINDNSLGIPLLKYVIEKEKKANQLIIREDSIFLNDKDISYQLTKSELRIIRFLVKNKNILVTRNQIAEKIWGVNWEHDYSDWAIDRLIYRLRLKLKKLGYDESLIKTYKSRGVRFG